MIKVALIDNMNNNFFAFARYLRDYGIDAHLYEISNHSMDHFSPHADTFETVDALNWIHEFPIQITNKNWFFFDKRKVFNEFRSYDLIISCGLSSAYLEKSGVQSDIIIPYGADLYQMPFASINFQFNLNMIRSFFWADQASYQKKAYRNARCIITNMEHPIYKQALDRLHLKGINYVIPMLYNKEITAHTPEKFSFLENHDFVVFNHSRQLWCSNPDNFVDFDLYKGNKRNDKTIKAFAEFLKITNYQNPVLVLFEYGSDIECSKKLIQELDIKKNVVWITKSLRKEIMYGLAKASLAVDQVRENICGIGGTSFEVLASGTPLMTYTNGALQNQDNLFFNAPIVEVLSEMDILNVFCDYENNSGNYKHIGKISQEWFDQHLGEGLALKYVTLINLLAEDKTLTQNHNLVRDVFEN